MTSDLPTPAAAPADDGELREAIYKLALSCRYAVTEGEVANRVMALIHARDARRDAALRQEIADLSAKLVEATWPDAQGEHHSAKWWHEYAMAWVERDDEQTAYMLKLINRAQAAEARCAELEAALRPFGKAAQCYPQSRPEETVMARPYYAGQHYSPAIANVGDLRRARAALTPADGAAQEGRDG